jgi:imidazoleglycerol phosphate dehydratase HisB
MGKAICDDHGTVEGVLVCKCLQRLLRDDEGVSEIEQGVIELHEQVILDVFYNSTCLMDPPCQITEKGEVKEKSFDRFGPVCTHCFRAFVDRNGIALDVE